LAATVVGVPGSDDVWGKHRVKMADITGDSSYPAGGYVLTAAQFGLRNILSVDFIGGNLASLGAAPVWNPTTGKMMLEAAAADLTPTTNVSTFTYRALVYSTDD
jgi:hypothetical protein